MVSAEEWRPGSFTKNFSWGTSSGLKELYEVIRTGFAGEMKDVLRDDFRRRVAHSGRPDYIPINFFLFNKIEGGKESILADELVFQALHFRHSQNFDKLALYAFNFSYVGVWRGAQRFQSRPALWAHHYITDRIASQENWRTAVVSADDIERFVANDPRYKAQTSRKLATNLNHLYLVGRLRDFESKKVERWWVNALFLTLDRLIAERLRRGEAVEERQFESMLIRSGFNQLSGPRSVDKDLATKHLVRLYTLIGKIGRFSDERTRELQEIRLPDLHWFVSDPEPGFAVHPSNPRIAKSIPRVCAMLATLAGFEWVDFGADEDFDVLDFVRHRTRQALDHLKQKGVEPTMSAEDLMKLLRD